MKNQITIASVQMYVHETMNKNIQVMEKHLAHIKKTFPDIEMVVFPELAVHGLNKDLGFTDADRVENIRRVAEVSKLMTDAGLITLVSFISPFKSERKMARDLFEKNEFLEIFVDTPLQECEKRDPKGLYQKARSGKLKNFTGIDSKYEVPISPEIKLQTVSKKPEELADEILNYMKKNNII